MQFYIFYTCSTVHAGVPKFVFLRLQLLTCNLERSCKTVSGEREQERFRDTEEERMSRDCRVGGGAIQRLEGVTCGHECEHTSCLGYPEKESAQGKSYKFLVIKYWSGFLTDFGITMF